MSNLTVSEQVVTAGAIKQQIAKLEAERDEFVKQANQQIAAMTGGINTLKALLAEPGEQPAPEEAPAE